MKAPFWLQVAVVCLILVIGALCLPVPEGGLLVHRLSGLKPREPDVRTVMPLETDYVPPSTPFDPSLTPAPRTPEDDALVRFSQTLDFEEDASRSTDAWSAGTAGGREAWRDNKSGMIWGPRLDLTLSSFSEENMNHAIDACAQEYPEGAWLLPSGAEFDIAKVNGILKADKDARHRWITFITIPPDIHHVMPAGRGYVPVSKEKHFSVRCIARGENAPANGYLTTDTETTIKALAE